MSRLLRRFGVFRRSLLTQYMLIVLCALVLVPIALPIVTITLMIPMQAGGEWDDRYRNGLVLEERWHAEAGRLDAAPEGRIAERLAKLHEEYPGARLSWIGGDGRLRLQAGELDASLLEEQASSEFRLALAEEWTASYTMRFMKERFGGDPFTVVAFVGGGQQDRGQGFLILEVPRALMESTGERVRTHYGWIFAGGTFLVLGLFLFISILFFARIRKRLVRLETAMSPGEGASHNEGRAGIPSPVVTVHEDEIGRLEQSFNTMVAELMASRQREHEEEALRRDLIAKLSHDLRTPLTAIRGHAYNLRKEGLSASGADSIALIERKIDYLGKLIDNLLSYSLLSSGKYPYQPREVDIVRTARTLFAVWYPVFEREGFEIELELADAPIRWHIDPDWLERVLDNYIQNVIRHAKHGGYVALRVREGSEGGGEIVIQDRGSGLTAKSMDKGAGLGLSIASLMLKEMRLRGVFDSSGMGTSVTIVPIAYGSASN